MGFLMFNCTTRARREWNSKIWPAASELLAGGFAAPHDTIELVEISTEKLSYHGLDYTRQKVYTYGMERINLVGTGYVSVRERAADWLAEQKSPTGLTLPKPRCKKCMCVTEDVGSAQSIRDSGLCWECRGKKAGNDVVLPRPKKKSQ